MAMSNVPSRLLSSGAQVPGIGLGTFGSDKYSPDQVAAAVRGAVEVGYRHFDCAAVYGNERQIGRTFVDIQASGISREELWITSKLWNDRHADPEKACEESLADLQLDYLDLYLVHWPFPNYHAPGVDVSARDPHAKPYIHDDYMQTWKGLERLKERGLVRHIGTSNMTVSKLQRVLSDAETPPDVNEMELHPHFQQPELFDFVVNNGILPIGYSPIGSPSRPERDRTPEDTTDIEDPFIVEIAEKRGVSPVAICIQWAITRGQIPIPFSVKRHQFEESFNAACAGPLTPQEMDSISRTDRNCRLIKGQVFLWPEAAGWEALWD